MVDNPNNTSETSTATVGTPVSRKRLWPALALIGLLALGIAGLFGYRYLKNRPAPPPPPETPEQTVARFIQEQQPPATPMTDDEARSTYYSLAVLYLDHKEYAKSVEYFGKTEPLIKDPQPDFFNAFAAAQEGAGQKQEALTNYQKVVSMINKRKDKRGYEELLAAAKKKVKELSQ